MPAIESDRQATLAALITVYHRIKPAELSQALASLAAQSRPADEIVIVKDGPVGEELDVIIDSFVEAQPEARTVELPTNQGSGPASQAGMETIETDFVARLDSDDIAAKDRFRTQLEYFAAHPDIDVLGSALGEFHDSPSNIVGNRVLPETHEEIARYARINSPVNNPSVMMRTQAVHDAGGYRAVHHMEDYDLYARMLSVGKRFHNLPESLTYFRTSPDVFERRTGKGMFAAERQMQRNLVKYGLVSRPRAWANLGIRTAYRLLPAQTLQRVYGRLFHRKGEGAVA